MLHNLPLNLRLIRKCPVCSYEYQSSMVQVLDESELGILTYATCSHCGANLLTKFASVPQGVVGNAILTDLKPQEVMDFTVGDDLTADQVLALQEIIKEKNLIKKFKELI